MRNAIFLALGLAVAGLVHAQDVSNSVDRFTGERIVQFRSPIDSSYYPRLSVTFKGAEQGSLSFGVAMPRTRSGGWRFLGCQTIDWLVDGQRLDLGAAAHDGQAVAAGTAETVTQFVTVEQIQTMAKAERIEYRICNESFVMAREDLAGLRDLAASLAAQPITEAYRSSAN